MGLLDSLGLGDVLKGALGQVEAAALPALINTVLAQTQYHDLNGLVAALQQGGLGPQVQSWLGNGRQYADHRRSAQSGARQRPGAGIRPPSRPAGRPDAGLLAQYLPEIVDKASPNGTLKTS